jgi:hypothetical protein
MYFSEYISGFSDLQPRIWPHLLCLVTKAMSDGLLARFDTIGERAKLVYLTPGEHAAKEWLDKI